MIHLVNVHSFTLAVFINHVFCTLVKAMLCLVCCHFLIRAAEAVRCLVHVRVFLLGGTRVNLISCL